MRRERLVQVDDVQVAGLKLGKLQLSLVMGRVEHTGACATGRFPVAVLEVLHQIDHLSTG